MSRAFGDFQYKINRELPLNEQRVIAVPEFKVAVVEKGDCLFLSCDGFFEKLTRQQVAECLFAELSRNPTDVCGALSKLTDISLRRGSGDNMSALLVVFGGGFGGGGAKAPSSSSPSPSLSSAPPSKSVFKHRNAWYTTCFPIPPSVPSAAPVAQAPALAPAAAAAAAAAAGGTGRGGKGKRGKAALAGDLLAVEGDRILPGSRPKRYASNKHFMAAYDRDRCTACIPTLVWGLVSFFFPISFHFILIFSASKRFLVYSLFPCVCVCVLFCFPFSQRGEHCSFRQATRNSPGRKKYVCSLHNSSPPPKPGGSLRTPKRPFSFSFYPLRILFVLAGRLVAILGIRLLRKKEKQERREKNRRTKEWDSRLRQNQSQNQTYK